MAARRRTTAGLFMLALAVPGAAAAALRDGSVIPATEAVALDGHIVSLPKDLQTPATVLILGFGRHSADATTAWEKPVRTQLARAGQVGFYDMAVIAEVPRFIRPAVMRSMRHDVPDVLKPNFLPLTDEVDGWKRVAAYAADQPDTAYVLLVDRTGRVQWTTHAAFTPEGFNALSRETRRVAAQR